MTFFVLERHNALLFEFGFGREVQGTMENSFKVAISLHIWRRTEDSLFERKKSCGECADLRNGTI